jgi:hypothetical protein
MKGVIPIDSQTLEQRVTCIAITTDRDEKTVKTWIREGMDPYSPESICQWWAWKNSRIKNRPNHEKPVRRIRTPTD